MIVALPARAKLNTRLFVTGTLEDGRHELDTDLVSVSLADLVEVELATHSSVDVTGLPIPAGENLVERARSALEAAVGRALPAAIRVHKRVPAGAGLGGGSSDAAATLRALSRLYRLDVDLHAVAAGVGADVAFLLCGGAARATGAGDVLARTAPQTTWFAIAWPGFAVSTAAVYAAYDRVGGDRGNHLQRAAEAVEPRLHRFAAMLGDDWRMTGSGSAFFRECATQSEAAAAASRLECWTAVARTVGGWC